ncbi:hypothetical protein DB346_18160 [Verrucomicrobia bacterium LW23]|nr:hypothetical protein DB346_18160 [Verrucomicrobia bacterium LW23]
MICRRLPPPPGFLRLRAAALALAAGATWVAVAVATGGAVQARAQQMGDPGMQQSPTEGTSDTNPYGPGSAPMYPSTPLMPSDSGSGMAPADPGAYPQPSSPDILDPGAHSAPQHSGGGPFTFSNRPPAEASRSSDDKPAAESSTKITSRRFFQDPARGVGVFEGDVVMQSPQFQVRAQRVEISFNKAQQDKVSRLIAVGKVVVVQPDRRGTADKLVYDIDTKRVELTGNAVVHEVNRVITGPLIVIDRNTDSSQVLGAGRKKIILNPGNGKASTGRKGAGGSDSSLP